MNARRYNSGKPRVGLLPIKALKEVVEVYERGAHKYSIYLKDGVEVRGSEIPYDDRDKYELVEDGGNNWRKGMSFTKTYESCTRHLWEWYLGNDIDEELNTLHLANAAWNLLALIEMKTSHPELDDRIYKNDEV